MATSTRHFRERVRDELSPVFFFLWLASVVRVPFGLLRHETFGVIPTLALVCIGLIPVLSLRQMNLSQSFREEGRSGTASRGARVTRRVLVAAQVASDAPHLMRFYKQYFRRQGSFPVFERPLS